MIGGRRLPVGLQASHGAEGDFTWSGYDMPLFMDRHDLRGASPDAVAAAHKKDLEVQDRHFCKVATYWYDEPRGSAFCLVEAPSAEAVRGMHDEAHGLLPNEIVEVDPSTVSQFLGRVGNPEAAEAAPIRESAFRAILFVDMVRSTYITRTLGDLAALEIVDRYRSIVRTSLLSHGGREVDRAGDGFLTSFLSAFAAVRCAEEIQRGVARDRRHHRGGPPLEVRMGIGAGEPVRDGDALFGSTVNLTSRICDAAEPGQIIAAGVIRDLCIGKDVQFTSLGSRTLKGFDEPTDLELVQWHE